MSSLGRRLSRPVAVGGVVIGGGAPVVVQSMTNTDTADAAATARQVEELARAGRYAEALGHRFLALVLELDRRKALRFHASKTPAEYVWEARLTEMGRASLAGLVAHPRAW